MTGPTSSPTAKKNPLAKVIIGSPSASLQQTVLFSRKAIIEYPQQTPSADSLGEVEADDGHRYYIKGDAHGRRVRASEWLSTHIAEEVHIGAPAPVVIERKDGQLVFGSRRIAGVADLTLTAAYLTSPTFTNMSQAPSGLRPILSSIYVLDMFLHNDDRHLGNYLTVDDNGVRRLYAYDFSRALFWDWPWSGFPDQLSHTRQFGSLLRSLHGFDQFAAVATIDRLEALELKSIEGFINRMPGEWLPAQLRDELVVWWENGGRQNRLNAIRTGISDGSIL
jgi:hypothetical protein